MRIRNCLSILMLAAAAGASAQEGGDTQAQIDYAYQTEDGNRLTNLIQNLTARLQNDSADNALRYHLPHAQYRLGLLARDRHARRADPAFSDRITDPHPVIANTVKSHTHIVLLPSP